VYCYLSHGKWQTKDFENGADEGSAAKTPWGQGMKSNVGIMKDRQQMIDESAEKVFYG